MGQIARQDQFLTDRRDWRGIGLGRHRGEHCSAATPGRGTDPAATTRRRWQDRGRAAQRQTSPGRHFTKCQRSFHSCFAQHDPFGRRIQDYSTLDAAGSAQEHLHPLYSGYDVEPERQGRRSRCRMTIEPRRPRQQPRIRPSGAPSPSTQGNGATNSRLGPRSPTSASA